MASILRKPGCLVNSIQLDRPAPGAHSTVYHMWTRLGLPYSTMLQEHGIHCVSAQATTNFVRELVAGDLIVVDGAVARIGTKSTTFHLRMHHADTGALHATYDVVEVFFDPTTRTSTAMPAAVRSKLERALLPDPER